MLCMHEWSKPVLTAFSFSKLQQDKDDIGDSHWKPCKNMPLHNQNALSDGELPCLFSAERAIIHCWFFSCGFRLDIFTSFVHDCVLFCIYSIPSISVQMLLGIYLFVAFIPCDHEPIQSKPWVSRHSTQMYTVHWLPSQKRAVHAVTHRRLAFSWLQAYHASPRAAGYTPLEPEVSAWAGQTWSNYGKTATDPTRWPEKILATPSLNSIRRNQGFTMPDLYWT